MDSLSESVEKIKSRPGNLLVPAAIVALTSPGVFFTIPGETSWFELSKSPVNYKVLAVHAFLAGFLITFARDQFADYY